LSSASAPDVLAVGAGPTGLSLAANVHALGASVRIIDRSVDRSRESRALAVQPRTLELLDSLGIAEALVARGRTSVRLRIRVGRRTVAVPFGDVGVEDSAFPSLLFVSQAETEAVLTDHLMAHDVQVERGVELVSFQADDDAVACVVRHVDGRQEHVRCRYLVGCDGAHNTVRHLADIPFQGDAYPQTFFLGDVEADGDLEAGSINAFVSSGAVAFFFPLGQPATWRVIGMHAGPARWIPSGGAATEAAAASLQDLQSVTDVATSGSVRLRDPAWMTVFRLHHRQAARYRAGRVFLAGDAAHIHSPAGAQGMNTGIQDAWNLAWKLALVVRARPRTRCWTPTRQSAGRWAAFCCASPIARSRSQDLAGRSSPFSETSWLRDWRPLSCVHGAFARSLSGSSRSWGFATARVRWCAKVIRRPAAARGPATGCRMPESRATDIRPGCFTP